jgi:hypothetical protein
MKLDGRLALVTGASDGLGHARQAARVTETIRMR